MGLSITGYILDQPKVGQSNSPFTMTPNVYVSDVGAFNAAFPGDESVPRTEYHAFVLTDSGGSGTGPNNTWSFVESSLYWTKNEGVQRFDYNGSEGRFKTLPGSAPIAVGVLSSGSNTTRLKVSIPVSTDTTDYPIRISVGTGSGVTFTTSLVANDAAFTTPSSGNVQISLSTGNLNWRPADLVTYAGQNVRFQRQTFYLYKDSSGNIGNIGAPLLLSPLPATHQIPLIRIGFGKYLTATEKPNEGAFSSNPSSGNVEWSRNTGRLKFNSTDISGGHDVYYDGVVFGLVSIPVQDIGTVASPDALGANLSEVNDTFFRVSGVVQFPQTVFVDGLSSPGKKGVVQIQRSDGQVQFSDADIALYGSMTAQVVFSEIPIERGISLRLYRTPVNLDAADPTIKDLSAFYTSTGAVLASPIIASPSVGLPAVPVDTLSLTLKVLQGTGTFTSNDLPRLDVPSPPTGVGYVIDYPSKSFNFAQRKVNQVIPALTPYGGVQLPDPLVLPSNLLLEIWNNLSMAWTSLVVGETALIDYSSGMVTLVDTSGVKITEGAGANFSGVTFTDSTQNFTLAGVQPGNFLVVSDNASKGVYTVATSGTTSLTTDVSGASSSNLAYTVYDGVEILADRFFYNVPAVDPFTKLEKVRALGATTNSPRLNIDIPQITTSRFRFGKLVFSSVVTIVPTDGDFTLPGSLASGVVEVSQSTGNLNFSQIDVTAGLVIYWVRTLKLGIDYTLQAALGFIQFTDRMLESEEALISYKTADNLAVQERAAFLVRKEKLTHPTPTGVMSFNPLGREVASNPIPKAFRGGRPQTSSQVQFDTTLSTVSFIEASTVTDALPSGPIVAPSESVYVDYYIYEAIGGEQNFTVLQAPMKGNVVVITSDTTSFYVAGDQTSAFQPDSLILVSQAEVYLVGSSTYDSVNQVTQIGLASPQRFNSDFRNPSLAVSSGPIRVIGTVLNPSYFLTEMTPYEITPMGSSKVLFQGDVSRTYVSGVILLFTGTGFSDFYLVTGATFDSSSGKTTVTLTANTCRQYDGVSLSRSVRPVLPNPSASLNTSRSPELTQPYAVYRRVEGEVGTLLSSPADYKIDASGVVTLTSPLSLNEGVGIFYTGDLIVGAGQDFRASYTFGIVPSEDNGLLNQILTMDYTTYAPDSFYWRVETFTNFRGELSAAYSEAAKSSVPTGGPILENSSQPKLFEQGRESIYYQEGYLANEDLVARPTLQYYNLAINYLEEALRGLDGRVVGDHDGKFLFDGSITNPVRDTFASVTNQIDDRFKISDAPYIVTGPPFVATSVGTYQEVYKASASSRFYPTVRSKFGVTLNPAGLSVGDPLMDLGITKLTSAYNVQTRLPWAIITLKSLAGDTLIHVDNALGSTDLLRPKFVNGMVLNITQQDGTVLVPDIDGIVVTGVTSDTISLSALPVDIPKGSTVRLALTDPSFVKHYRLGIDLGADLDKGALTYLDPSNPSWAALTPVTPTAGETLDVGVSLNNLLTAPDRFPALDGKSTDDDGNRQFPLLTPSTYSEVSSVGWLTEELHVISTGTGILRTATTAPYVSTGSLDGSGTVITNLSGNWPSPVPQVHDLIDIRSGTNSPANFRRITVVGASTVTVNSAYPHPSVTGFTLAVTAGNNLITGTSTITSGVTLTDGAANFNAAGVKPGHTVVMTSGSNIGLRRQVVAVLSATSLTITALPNSGSFTYRISNSLATFGGTNSIVASEWVPVLDGEFGVLISNGSPTSEFLALTSFFNVVFTNVVTGFNGVSSTSTFTSAGSTFLSSVTPSHLLYISTGTAFGLYKIQTVNSNTVLTIVGTFPVNTSSIGYRVVKVSDYSVDNLQSISAVTANVLAALPSITSIRNLVTTAIPVEGDSGAFATRLLKADLDSREADIYTRSNQVSTDIGTIESELFSGDRLYDKRYTWIDSRINLINGILTKIVMAAANRLKAQQETLKQLTKLLSMK